MSSDVRPLVAIRVISIVRTRGNLREKTKDRRVLRVLRRLSSSRGIMRFQARAHAGARARAFHVSRSVARSASFILRFAAAFWRSFDLAAASCVTARALQS